MDNITKLKDSIVQLVTFRLAEENFAVDILKVQEIYHTVKITKIPEVPDYCMGIINLRGKVMPVIDLRTKFGLPVKEWDKDTRIIVCNVEHSLVGMVVDNVEEVLRIQSSIIEPAPDIVTSCDSEYITGMAKLDECLLIILNIARIVVDANYAIDSVAQIDDSQEATIISIDTDDDHSTVAENHEATKDTKMHMVEKIIDRLKDVTRELNDNTAEIASANDNVISCAEATVAAAKDMSKLTSQQSQKVVLVTTTIEEVTSAFTESWEESNSNSDELAKIIKEIQNDAESAAQSIESGIEMVLNGREIANQASGTLKNAVTSTQEAMNLVEQMTKGKAVGGKKRSQKLVGV